MKKWTKLFSFAIGIFMAIGAAVGVKQTAERVNAESETISFMTNATNLGYSSGTQSNLSMTVDDVTLTFSSISAKNGDKVQLVKSGTISSTSFAGAITSIKVYDCLTTSAKTDGSFELLGSTNGSSFTSIDTVSGLSSTATNKTFSVDSSKNYTYFKIVNGSARVLLTSEIDVTYYVDDSEGDKTLDSILDVSATITARQGDTKWTIEDASATGIVSGVPNQDVTSMVNFSVETDVPSTAGQTNVTLRATKKDSVEGDATYFEKTISATVTENPFASFTKVTDADDVSSSCVYALSNDGNNFVGNTISNKGLVYPATDIEDVGFFKLDANGGLQLVTNQSNTWSGAIDAFINNSSSTDLSLGTRSSVWEAKENSTSGVYLSNKSNSNRFLGLNKNVSTDATLAKAYAATNLNKDNIPVYLYEVYEDVSPLITLSAPRNYLMVGETGFTITAHKENFDENLTWETSNSNIATVSNGVVTPVNYGKVTITAKYGEQAEDSIDLVVYPDNTNTISIALALEICELTGNTNSPYSYTVVGVVGEVTKAYSNETEKMTFELIDENLDIITCYQVMGTHPVQEGAKIQITGNLINYTKEATVTPEFASGSTYREFYTVRFFNGDEQYGADVEALEGEKLNKPTDPEKEDFAFVGWEDADGNMWNFDNDTVDGDIDLTSVWNNVAEVALQEDLNNIKPWMSLAYRYNDTRNYQNITIGISSSHKDINGNCSQSTEKDITSVFDNDVGITFIWNSGEGTTWWFKQNDVRLYKNNTLTISAAEGQFIKSVAIINASGNTVTSNHAISYASGNAIISVTDTIKNIAAFEIEYGSGGFTDVDFRIKMAIDDMSDLAEEHSVTEYGVEISDGTTTRSYAFGDATRTSTDTNGTKQYMVIGLGDVFAHTERLQAVFSLKAYAVLNGKKLYSTNVKQHSVVSLVESYHGMSDYSDLVDSLYQYFVSVDLIDED